MKLVRKAAVPTLSDSTLRTIQKITANMPNWEKLLPSQQMIEQLTKLQNSILASNTDSYLKLAKSIQEIPIPDFSKFQSHFVSEVDTSKVQLLTETYNANLRLLQNETEPRKELTAKVDEMTTALMEIEGVVNLGFLSGRIHTDALEAIKENKFGLKAGFLDPKASKCTVLAIDIRRSTELMLKAKDPFSFAKFISTLTNLLKTVVIENFGVFDKFTGDGILAYFPAFYSGTSSVRNALMVAEKSHEIFKAYYRDTRSLFRAVLVDTGLGIGIDSGPVNIVTVNDEITVVGVPVVYACRLSGAPHGQTYLNQSAYDEISNDGSTIRFSEIVFDIKNEGPIGVFQVEETVAVNVVAPEWKR